MAKVTSNLSLLLDPVGYVGIRQAYVSNMQMIGQRIGLELPAVVLGRIPFELNFRANVRRIEGRLGIDIALPKTILGASGLAAVFGAAMVRIDSALGTAPPLALISYQLSFDGPVSDATVGVSITGPATIVEGLATSVAVTGPSNITEGNAAAFVAVTGSSTIAEGN